MSAGPNGRACRARRSSTGDRRELTPARHRLRRPLPDPPPRPRHAARGDAGGAHDVVQAGKVRYLGASSMCAWEFAKLLSLTERNGWTRFVTMQDHYNLLAREEEREMLPLLRRQGVGVIPWSPLARGKLTRPWDSRDEPVRDRRVRQAACTPTATPTSCRRSSTSPPSAACPRERRPRLGHASPGRHRPDRRRLQAAATSTTRSPPSTSTSPTTRSPASRRPTPPARTPASPEPPQPRTPPEVGCRVLQRGKSRQRYPSRGVRGR